MSFASERPCISELRVFFFFRMLFSCLQQKGRVMKQLFSIASIASVFFLSVMFFGISSSALAYPIAGLTPDQRPVGAPVIKEMKKTPEWYTNALRGVSEPYPYSLKFLEDQGAWYTPFIHPGMMPPYDIRGWHQKTAALITQ